jgi:predicted nucleotidyltransferase
MPSYEIEELKNNFINQLSPVKIYLFGSYANDTYTDESDLDFYIINDNKQKEPVSGNKVLNILK